MTELPAARRSAPPVAERRCPVVLYHHDLPSMTEVREALTHRGHEVHNVGLFVDALRWLLRYGDSAALVLELPAVDTFRRAVLTEVRRIGRAVPVVALARAVTLDVERDAEAAGVGRVLPTAASVQEIVNAVQLACGSARPRLVVVAGRAAEGVE